MSCFDLIVIEMWNNNVLKYEWRNVESSYILLILFVYLEYFIGRVLEECREKCLNVWWLCGYMDVLCKFLKIFVF